MRPTREQIRSHSAAYFVSTQTAQRRAFFRHERWAELFQETLFHYAESSYMLHAYVIMPDHVHLLISPLDPLEKSVQLFKGGFSFRAKKQFDWHFEIWQQGFTDHRVRDMEDWKHHLEYIRQNPVLAHLTDESGKYPYLGFPNTEFPQGLKAPAVRLTVSSGSDRKSAAQQFPQGLKPGIMEEGVDVRAKARTLHAKASPLQAEAGPLIAESCTFQAPDCSEPPAHTPGEAYE